MLEAEELIPWKFTNSNFKAHKKLIEIYNWTTNPVNNSIIREFLLTHCPDFILPVTIDNPFFLGQENTGYSIFTFDCEADTNVK